MHFICAKSAAFSTHQIQPCHKTIQLWFCLCVGSEEHWPVKVNIDPVLYSTTMCWEHHFLMLQTLPLSSLRKVEGTWTALLSSFPVFGALLLGELYYRLVQQHSKNSVLLHIWEMIGERLFATLKTTLKLDRDCNTLSDNLKLKYSFSKIIIIQSWTKKRTINKYIIIIII